MTTDLIAAALPVCAGISYQLRIAGYFDASVYLRSDYMRGYVAATLADALEAERKRAEKAEVEVDQMRAVLNDIYENVEYWNTLRISSKIRAALQRKAGNE